MKTPTQKFLTLLMVCALSAGTLAGCAMPDERDVDNPMLSATSDTRGNPDNSALPSPEDLGFTGDVDFELVSPGTPNFDDITTPISGNTDITSSDDKDNGGDGSDDALPGVPIGVLLSDKSDSSEDSDNTDSDVEGKNEEGGEDAVSANNGVATTDDSQSIDLDAALASAIDSITSSSNSSEMAVVAAQNNSVVSNKVTLPNTGIFLEDD